jgi:hypothetical protein
LQQLCSFPSLHPKQLHIWTLPYIRFLTFHSYSTWHVGTNTSYALTTMVQAGFRRESTCLLRKGHFMVPVWLIGTRCGFIC